MSWGEAAQIIIRACREGVALFAKADGKLGWKAAQQPSDELLAVLRKHKDEILASLPPPPVPPGCVSLAVERARRIVARLQALGFRPYLDGQGALMIADATGRRRDVSQYLPIATLFEELNAGLDEDPGLLDETIKAAPTLATCG